MTRIVGYFLCGFFFVLAQTALLPQIFPFFLKPDLLLILIVYLGLNEKYVRGGFLAYIFGLLQDVFTGDYFGLYGFVLLGTFLVVRGVAERLNPESPLLLMLMIGGGTLLHGGLIFFCLGFFTESGPPAAVFFWSLLPQILLNLAATLLLLQLLPRLQRQLAPRRPIPGLPRLKNHHGS
jgi:rod shape-determining protein MreD